CADCHMPLVKSSDKGAMNGFVHSHAFPAANTAVPIANEDREQLQLTENFLKGTVTVDVFAISSASPKTAGAALPGAGLSTAFAVGEEAETAIPEAGEGEAAPV